MTNLPEPPRSALAVMAHPDDIEFLAGGLVSRWARAGVTLHYCLLTDGTGGSRDARLAPAELALLRRAEQRAAGAVFDVASYHFLGHPDGRLMDSVALRLAIARVIRQVRPEAVLSSDPLFFYSAWYMNHPDHRAASLATAAAIMPLANTALAALELLADGLAPHDVTDVYLAGAVSPTLYVALEHIDMERKLAAMRAHTSQSEGWDVEPILRGMAAHTAEAARVAGVACELAEGYMYINLRRPSGR